MRFKKFGNTELETSVVGVGTWAIGGGGWAYAWGEQDDKESISALHTALDLGVNWIDTAPVYGLGHSEEIVGRVLKDRIDKPYVFTKCGLSWNSKRKIRASLKRENIRGEIEASLVRLGIECVDLYQVHWPRDEKNLEEGWETLQELKEEGKIRYAGVSNFSVAQLSRISQIAPPDSLQPPLSLLKRESISKGEIEYCRQNEIAVIVYSPLQKGILTDGFSREKVEAFGEDDHRRFDPDFQIPLLDQHLEKVEQAKEMLKQYSLPLEIAAIGWTLTVPGVTGVIVGVRTKEQSARLRAIDKALETDEELYQRLGEIFG